MISIITMFFTHNVTSFYLKYTHTGMTICNPMSKTMLLWYAWIYIDDLICVWWLA